MRESPTTMNKKAAPKRASVKGKAKIPRTPRPIPIIYMTRSKEEEEFKLWARMPTFRKSPSKEASLAAAYRTQEKAVSGIEKPVYDWGKSKIKIKKLKPRDSDEDSDEEAEYEEEEIEIVADPDFVDREALGVDLSPYERGALKPAVGYTYVIPFPDTSLIDIATRDALKKVEVEPDKFSEVSGHSSISDPGIEEAFMVEGGAPKDFRDSVGDKHYLYMCHQLDVVPCQQFLRQLKTPCASFRYYGLDPRGIRPITEALSLNTYVRYLDLEDNWLTYDSACHLADLFRENDRIVGLNLTGCRLGPLSGWKLSEMLAVTRSLKTLLLSNNDLGDKGAAALAEGIAQNGTVLKLDLSRNRMGAHAAMAIGAIIEDNWFITELDLSWNCFFDKDGFKKLTDGLIRNPSIKILDFTGNALSLENMRALRTFIAKNKILKELNLSFNLINNKCLTLIRRAIGKNETLQTLRIGNNPITFVATARFLGIIQKFETNGLKLLDMTDIWVDKEFREMAKVLQKKRGLTIIHAGVLSDYIVRRPDELLLLMKRAFFEGMSPKKKKKKRDFGHFLLNAPKKPIPEKKFIKRIQEEKLKLEPALVQQLSDRFVNAKKKVDMQKMKERYLEYFPDTALPPPKEKKGKKDKKGKKGKKSKDAAAVGEAGPEEGDKKKTVTIVEEEKEGPEKPETTEAIDAAMGAGDRGDNPPVKAPRRPSLPPLRRSIQ